MGLRERLGAHLIRHGPLNVAQFMELCLHDAEGGYYSSHPRLGAEGDFITAPHVSQMFGELLGAWAADVWRQLGRPAAVRLIELGPGDATLMTDVLRAAPADFRAAARVALVERSPVLRKLQARALSAANPVWFEGVAEVPVDLPTILLGNEFLDCLPIRQAVRVKGAWRERVVGGAAGAPLVFGLGGRVWPQGAPPGASEAQVFEWSPALEAAGAEIGALVVKTGGAALFVDYAAEGPGDTLQAVRRHAREDPLANPGCSDLTARVDFASFLWAARVAGATTRGPTSQGAFLRQLGVEARAAALGRTNPGSAAKMGRQLERLLAPAEMGERFKAVCVHGPALEPAGFA